MPRLTLGLRLNEITSSVSAVTVPTNCYTPVEIDGDNVGYNSGTGLGVLIPSTTANGTFIYSFCGTISTGAMTASFGDAGDEQFDNVRLIIYKFLNNQVELFWDAANSLYAGVNMDVVNDLVDNVGNNVCFSALVIPDLLIHYTFSEVETAA